MKMTVQSVCSFKIPEEWADAQKFEKLNHDCEKVETTGWIHFKKIDQYNVGRLWGDGEG